MKVVVTDEARSDLSAITRYIAADNPERARTYVAELLAGAKALARMPEAFPLVPRYRHLGVRKRRHGAYLIFYRVDPGSVVILHVIHGARDYDALLAGG